MDKPKYCFKKCQPVNDQSIRLICTFELLDDTLIRPLTYNYNTKIRVNKVKLIKVEDMDGNYSPYETVESVIFSNYDVKSIFKLSQVTEINNFDLNDIGFSYGIHIFFNKVRAQLYLLDKLDFGIYTWWRDDGIKMYEISYNNGLKHGLTVEYFLNGQIKRKAMYNNNHLVDNEYFYNQKGELIHLINHNKKFNEYTGRHT
jgi:antitoxin component YwqK of YwqJK toxin-antitoxin module